MSIRTLTATFTGTKPLLMNNPQTVDRFNKFSKRMAEINAKKTRRTDEDYYELANLEVESKLYWDDEEGVYVPAQWIMAAMAKNSFKLTKIPKADVRSTVFCDEDKVALKYRSQNKVKSPADIVKNDEFRHRMLLPQGQVRIAKSMPIFHDWEFSFDIEFDDTVFDKDEMTRILEHCGKRGGFGDFRPTFGRADVTIEHHA